MAGGGQDSYILILSSNLIRKPWETLEVWGSKKQTIQELGCLTNLPTELQLLSVIGGYNFSNKTYLANWIIG